MEKKCHKEKKSKRGSDKKKSRHHRDEEEKSSKHKHQKRRDCTNGSSEGEEEWVEPNKTSGKRYTEKHHLDYKHGSDVSRKSKGGTKLASNY